MKVIIMYPTANLTNYILSSSNDTEEIKAMRKIIGDFESGMIVNNENINKVYSIIK